MNENIVNFKLQKITTGQFAIIDSVEINDNAIKLNFDFGFGVNLQYKTISCSVKFEFSSEDKPFIIINAVCEFGIEQKSWGNLLSNENRNITLPSNFATHLAVLTIGTARGILHCKSEGTKFNKYFLPTLDISNTLQNDIEINL